jgi:hypothetical protein
VIPREENPKPEQKKKAYKKPELRYYGTLREITNATANNGANVDSRSPVVADRTH